MRRRDVRSGQQGEQRHGAEAGEQPDPASHARKASPGGRRGAGREREARPDGQRADGEAGERRRRIQEERRDAIGPDWLKLMVTTSFSYSNTPTGAITAAVPQPNTSVILPDLTSASISCTSTCSSTTS